MDLTFNYGMLSHTGPIVKRERETEVALNLFIVHYRNSIWSRSDDAVEGN